VLSRVFRPLAVEATAPAWGCSRTPGACSPAAGDLEDVIAEAQARREQLDAETQATATDEASSEATVEDEAAPTGEFAGGPTAPAVAPRNTER